ncbi:MAG: hypothetical protein NT094_01525, partial [Candidatus Staskawiczbacteria bacterium]|nr:hypothetical protein [Candidatus Staskawiczbacteria bacterium]
MNKIILVFILGIIAYGASPAIGARGNGKGNNQNNNQRNGHSNIFNKDVQLPTDVPNALKPVIGKCEATFTGWEISAINSIPVVFINAIPNAIPNETNTTLGFLASNTKINKKDPNAIPSVNSLANDLKIGDKIKIDFVYVDEIRQIVDISLVSKINTETPMSFTLTGINSARMNSIERTKVKAIKKKMNCSFYVPSVPGTKDKTFINDPEMTKKLDQFSSGDEINIDYSTSNYMFIIKDV